jgi:methylmalonyl-CoA mutase N-terminal domain/subunit
VDPEVARTAVERIKQYKSDRDQQKTDQALERLVQAAGKLEQGEYGVLMPAAIEAAKAKATAGEISKALREVFRWGTEYSSQTTY